MPRILRRDKQQPFLSQTKTTRNKGHRRKVSAQESPENIDRIDCTEILEKDLQNEEFLRGQCLRTAVDNETSAVDTLPTEGDAFIQYRPHKTPANRHITGDAGDTVDILRGSLTVRFGVFTISIGLPSLW